MATILSCDRCGRVQATADGVWFKFSLQRGTAGVAMDLCPNCGDEVRELVLNWRGNGHGHKEAG